VQWDVLRAEDCVVAIPDGDFLEVTVTDCTQPHEAEVVGASFAMSGLEQSDCDKAFTEYTGKNPADVPDYYVDYLLPTDTFSNPKLICLASPVTGGQTIGSLAAP